MIKPQRRKIRGIKGQTGKLEINDETVDLGPNISIIIFNINVPDPI